MAGRNAQLKHGPTGGQDAVRAFMGQRLSYDPPPETVKRIDTHAAVVFLAGGYAYKVKRAVRLRYLDFSTLEKRRAVCEREVAINRLTAPDIYLGVVPIVRRAGGEVVEWAVKMVRFRQAGLFGALLRRRHGARFPGPKRQGASGARGRSFGHSRCRFCPRRPAPARRGYCQQSRGSLHRGVA